METKLDWTLLGKNLVNNVEKDAALMCLCLRKKQMYRTCGDLTL